MAIYTKLLAVGGGIVTTATALYTAPSSGVVVVRNIIMLHGAAGGARMFIGTGTGSVSGYLAALSFATADNTYSFDIRQVLGPGEKLWAYSNAPAGMFWRITGYVFDT